MRSWTNSGALNRPVVQHFHLNQKTKKRVQYIIESPGSVMCAYIKAEAYFIDVRFGYQHYIHLCSVLHCPLVMLASPGLQDASITALNFTSIALPQIRNIAPADRDFY